MEVKIDPPSYLGELGREKWAAILVDMGGVCANMAALGMLAAAWEVFLKSQAEIDAHGVVLAGANGRSWNNPAVNSLIASQKQIARLSKDLGLWREVAKIKGPKSPMDD